MQIFYCEGCGLRISNDDVSADAVIKHEDKMYCLKCAAAKGIKPPTKGSNTRLEAIKKAPDRGLRPPAPAATPAAAHSAVAVRAKKRSEESGKNAMTIGIVIGVAGLLLFLVNLFVFAGRPKNSEVASVNNGSSEKAADKPLDPRPASTTPAPSATATNPVKNETPRAPAGHFLETPKTDLVTKPVATPNVSPKTETPATNPSQPAVKTENVSNGNWECLPVDLQSSQVLSAAFSPDGKWLLCGCLDHSMMLIDLDTHKPQKITGHAERVASVAFSPNGKMFASGSWDRTAKIWDMETRTCKFTLSGHTHWIWSTVFSPDSATLATGSFDKSVRYWNTATGEGRKFDTHVSEVLSLDFAPAGTLLLAAGTGLTVRVWDFSNDTEKCSFRVNGVAHSAAFSPDGKLIGVGLESDKSVGVWDMNGKLQCTLHGHTNFIHSVCFLDNKTIVSCGRDKLVKVWDIPGSKELATLRGHTDVVNAVAFCPQRKILVSASNDGKLRFWTNAAFFESLGK
jgi:hypothetical protein